MQLWLSHCVPSFAVTQTWTDAADKCFRVLKQLLVDSSALALYDPALPSIGSTDTSDYGVGAVFTQIHPNNIERTVAFASVKLTQAERKCATVEKEALGSVWAVEKWRTYLWGHRFTLRTDHQALTTLLSTKGADRVGMCIA